MYIHTQRHVAINPLPSEAVVTTKYNVRKNKYIIDSTDEVKEDLLAVLQLFGKSKHKLQTY